MSENLSSIERVADLIYDTKNVSKRKRDGSLSESEESDEKEKNVTTEIKETTKEINEISEICSRRASKA
ncbi:hypothetical protein F8M41_022720 [Gigaspora margarita]|uniref:Uncharacterized protein n=1 Tax=Gigaspora margarita TaxID=4874 RepID=A0A8H4AEM9_GIGMA|nr:hypothetical protein F8M41_022720 [Gigaspora margarita]